MLSFWSVVIVGMFDWDILVRMRNGESMSLKDYKEGEDEEVEDEEVEEG